MEGGVPKINVPNPKPTRELSSPRIRKLQEQDKPVVIEPYITRRGSPVASESNLRKSSSGEKFNLILSEGRSSDDEVKELNKK